MTVSLREQLFLLSAGLITGGLLGLFSDLYRPVCRRIAVGFRIVSDMAAALLWTAWLFAIAMGTGAGFRGYLMASAALGWAVYAWALSAPVRTALCSARRRIVPHPGKREKKLSKTGKTAKKVAKCMKKTSCK